MPEQAKNISGHADLDDTSVCYWKTTRGWVIYLPNCGIGEISNHKIEEHEDGTITVSPSILMDGHKNGQPTTRHGYLRHGIWEEV